MHGKDVQEKWDLMITEHWLLLKLGRGGTRGAGSSMRGQLPAGD